MSSSMNVLLPDVTQIHGKVLVIIGVCGSGKSTIGSLLSQRLGWPLAEGDHYHSDGNKMKMKAGIPLTDEDRLPWLLSLHDVINKWCVSDSNGIVSCSALTRAYRDILRDGHHHKNKIETISTKKVSSSTELATSDVSEVDVGSDEQKTSEETVSTFGDHQSMVHFVYLKGSREALERRLAARTGHFMNASLLDSQLKCLEEPTSDEDHIVIDVNKKVEDIVQETIDRLINNL